MFQAINAPDRTKPEKSEYWAIITDEEPMREAHNLPGRLMRYVPTRSFGEEQRRRWTLENPSVKTRCVLLRRRDLEVRDWVDPRLHFANANSQYLH
jgi:hypothetical protein